MKIQQNKLYEWLPEIDDEDAENRLIRILWVSDDDVICIDVHDASALPVRHPFDDFEALYNSGYLLDVEIDPFAYIHTPDHLTPEKYRVIRDKNYELIKTIIEGDSGIGMYSRKSRGSLIRVACEASGKSRKVVYKLLRKYWQRGQVKNALLPDYDRSGPKQGEANITVNKLGRKNAHELEVGERVGILITEREESLFERGINRFYIKGQLSLRETFRRILNEYFRKGMKEVDGVLEPQLPPISELPTFRQFTYWYYDKYDRVKVKRKRLGESEYNRNHRALLSDATKGVQGIGAICEIDATPIPICLLSSLTGNPIKRPTLYLIKDVKSRMIVGYVITYEHASWEAARLAIETMARDKVELCAKYGITITDHDWPCVGMPKLIRGDRGEMESHNVDNLPSSILNTQIVNNPPYSPQMKGIVERAFWQFEVDVVSQLNGYIRKKKRGDKYDPCEKATLTIYDLNQAVIRWILHYNNRHRMEKYPLSDRMIKDNLQPYPIEIWNWCAEKEANHFRVYDTKVLIANLLPYASASITENGIAYEGLMYQCARAYEEGWFDLAAARGSWYVDAAYDPRAADVLYLRLDKGRNIVECRLLNNSAMQPFFGKTWEEVKQYRAQQRAKNIVSSSEDTQSKGKLNAQIEHINDTTLQINHDLIGIQSDKSNMRTERKKSKNAERQDRLAEGVPADPTEENYELSTTTEVDEQQDEPTTYVKRPSLADQIRKSRKSKSETSTEDNSDQD